MSYYLNDEYIGEINIDEWGKITNISNEASFDLTRLKGFEYAKF